MYDKEIISIVAKNHGYSEEVLNDIDEKASNSLLYALSTGAYTHHTHLVSGLHIPLNDKAFMAYAEVIKELAEKESCIIVGRCADSILKDHENLFRVFIHCIVSFTLVQKRNVIKQCMERAICKGCSI